MPGKANFHVLNKQLKDANYSLALGGDVYVASYQQRLLIGPISHEEGPNPVFSKKAIVIPSSCYFEFVNCVHKAHKCFEENDDRPWESLLYKHNKVKHVIAKYEAWEDQPPMFRVNIKWNFAQDKQFARLCEEGLETAIDTSELKDKEWLYIRRACMLDSSQVEILQASLEPLMEHSYYEEDSKKIVLEFINYVMSSKKLREFVAEKIKDYEQMNYQSKMKLIRDVLEKMFEEKKNVEEKKNLDAQKNTDGQNQEERSYEMKKYFDALGNKIMLIYSLLNNRLKTE